MERRAKNNVTPIKMVTCVSHAGLGHTLGQPGHEKAAFSDSLLIPLFPLELEIKPQGELIWRFVPSPTVLSSVDLKRPKAVPARVCVNGSPGWRKPEFSV